MDYLNNLWSKWMHPSTPRVAVDSHPRLSGIMDTVNASLAHGPDTKLPSEFYDPKAREYMHKIAVDEWYSGYRESVEYRKLGIGALMGDIVDRMVSTAVQGGWNSDTTAAGTPNTGVPIRLALSGCHDTTLAAILNSVDALETPEWPPFTSSIAVELFSKKVKSSSTEPAGVDTAGVMLEELNNPVSQETPPKSGLFSFLTGRSAPSPPPPSDVARKPLDSFPAATRDTLRKYYVRIRYNDRPMRIPGCAAKPANHLPGDDTFCTLDAFKEIVDKFTPQNWREECLENLGEGMFGKGEKERVPAGY